MVFVNTLGQLKYLSTIKYVDAVVGNSSSGILEVPSFNVPTINIGPRQKGRLMADSVLSCADSPEEILTALNRAISEPFKTFVKTTKSPYGNGGVSERIVEVLKNADLSPDVIMKHFFDLEKSII